MGKRGLEEDGTYVDSGKVSADDYQISQKPNKKLAAIDRQPPKRRKTVTWKSGDDEKIRLGLINYKNDYAKIKTLFFKERDITGKDIANRVANNDDLKSIKDSNLNNAKQVAITKFRNNCRPDTDEEDTSSCGNSSESEEDEDEKEVIPNNITTPKILNNGCIIVPNETFLREVPFFDNTEKDKYRFAMRFHLSQYLDVQILPIEKVIEWKFTNVDVLTDSERKCVGNQDMFLIQSQNRISIQHTPLPEDVDLSREVEFLSHDTTSG